VAFGAEPTPFGFGQDAAHLLRSHKSRQDVLVAGTICTKQFNHGRDRFAVDR
jgi:hypothetical protein